MPPKLNVRNRGRGGPKSTPFLVPEVVDLEKELIDFEQYLDTPAAAEVILAQMSSGTAKKVDADNAKKAGGENKVCQTAPVKSILKKSSVELVQMSATEEKPSEKTDSNNIIDSAESKVVVKKEKIEPDDRQTVEEKQEVTQAPASTSTDSNVVVKKEGKTWKPKMNKYASSYDISYPFQVRVYSLPITYNMKELLTQFTHTFKTEICKAMTFENRHVVILYFKDKDSRDLLLKTCKNFVYFDSELVVESWPPEGEDYKRPLRKKKPTFEERIIFTHIPYINVPYDDQLMLVKKDAENIAHRLHGLLCYRNKSLSGWAEDACKQNGGDLFKIEPVARLAKPESSRVFLRCKFGRHLNQIAVGFILPNGTVSPLEIGDRHVNVPDYIKLASKLVAEFARASGKKEMATNRSGGFWEEVLFRATPDGKVMIVIKANPDINKVDLAKIKADLKQFFTNGPGKDCNPISVYLYLDKASNNEFIKNKQQGLTLIVGQPDFTITAVGIEYTISPFSHMSFSALCYEILYSSIVKLAAPTEDSVVFDLYAGCGGIGFSIAKDCQKVYAIESIEKLVLEAETYKVHNKIKNVELIKGTVENSLASKIKAVPSTTPIIVILDPPKTGTDIKVIDIIRAQKNVKRVVYVISNTSAEGAFTLDFMDFCSSGGTGLPFLPLRAIPIDISPFTSVNNLVVVLERVPPSKYPEAEKKPPVPDMSRDSVDRNSKPPLLSRIKIEIKERKEAGRGRGVEISRGRGSGRSPASPSPKRPRRDNHYADDNERGVDFYGNAPNDPGSFWNSFNAGMAVMNPGMNMMGNFGAGAEVPSMSNYQPDRNDDIISAYERRIAELEEREKIRQYELRIAELEEQDRIARMRKYEQRIAELEEQSGRTGDFEKAGGFIRGELGTNALLNKYENRIDELEQLVKSSLRGDRADDRSNRPSVVGWRGKMDERAQIRADSSRDRSPIRREERRNAAGAFDAGWAAPPTAQDRRNDRGSAAGSFNAGWAASPIAQGRRNDRGSAAGAYNANWAASPTAQEREQWNTGAHRSNTSFGNSSSGLLGILRGGDKIESPYNIDRSIPGQSDVSRGLNRGRGDATETSSRDTPRGRERYCLNDDSRGYDRDNSSRNSRDSGISRGNDHGNERSRGGNSDTFRPREIFRGDDRIQRNLVETRNVFEARNDPLTGQWADSDNQDRGRSGGSRGFDDGIVGIASRRGNESFDRNAGSHVNVWSDIGRGSQRNLSMGFDGEQHNLEKDFFDERRSGGRDSFSDNRNSFIGNNERDYNYSVGPQSQGRGGFQRSSGEGAGRDFYRRGFN